MLVHASKGLQPALPNRGLSGYGAPRSMLRRRLVKAMHSPHGSSQDPNPSVSPSSSNSSANGNNTSSNNGSSSKLGHGPTDSRLGRLLRLTAIRSNKKQQSLPPWYTRTQDPDDLPALGDAPRSTSSYSSSSSVVSSDARNEWHLPWDDGSNDTAKEYERKFRRAVFSFDRWAAHRSTGRYLRHFKGILSSRTFKGLLPPLQFLAAMSFIACLYQGPGVSQYHLPAIYFGEAPLDVTAFALSLLLVFRTDSSYARWEEALRTWNEVRSASKDVARQAIYWVDEPARKGMLVRWTMAFSRVLLVHVRADVDLEDQLRGVLLPAEVEAVVAVGPEGAPSFVLQVISELVEQCRLSEIKEDKMFSSLKGLGDSVAVCEKLLRYPIPLAYTRHTSRFMGLWLMAMPFAFWQTCGWATIPLTLTIAYLLLGIDEIGVQIEEPLSILPIEDVCADIEAEISAMIERQDIVTEVLIAGGVACPPRSTCGACGAPLPCEDEEAAASALSPGRSAALSTYMDEPAGPAMEAARSTSVTTCCGTTTTTTTGSSSSRNGGAPGNGVAQTLSSSSSSSSGKGKGKARPAALSVDLQASGPALVRGYDDQGAPVLHSKRATPAANGAFGRDDKA